MVKSKNLLLSLLLLAGCQTIPESTVFDTTSTTAKKEIVIDQEAMKDCENLTYFSYPSTFEQFMVIYSINTQKYADCKNQNAAKKKILQDLTKKSKQ